MKKVMVNKIIFFILIMLTINGIAFAGESSGLSASMSASIFKKINEFRADPYIKVKEFAEKENLANALPLWVEELNGLYLAPLNFNSVLIKTSSAHIDDMANRNYFSETTPENAGISERLESVAIQNLLSRESIGIVLFRNYIAPVIAEESVFKAIIKYELSKPNRNDSLVFNSEISEMAVSVKSSTFKFQGRSFNSYIAAVDGIKSETNFACMEISSKLSALINQARMKPEAILKNQNFDEKFSSSFNGAFYPALQKINYNRDEFAKYSINNLPETGAYVISKNNSVIESLKNISLSRMITDTLENQGVNSITDFLFTEILSSELMTDNPVKILFNTDLNRVFSEISIIQDFFEDKAAVKIKLDLAAWHEASEKFEISGLIYGDKDSDGLYDPGEEKAFEPILLFDKGIHAKTDSAGAYYMNEMGSLSFMLVVFDEEKGLVFRENQGIINGKFCLENLNE